jgi:hypothetical protein
VVGGEAIPRRGERDGLREALLAHVHRRHARPARARRARPPVRCRSRRR